MKFRSESLEDTEKIAGEFLSKYQNGIIGLSGDLGSGKTTFVKAIGKNLGITEIMTSPTFVIMKRYDHLIHIDAYRLQNGEELLKLNFADLANDPKNLILIEWPENVISALPENFHRISFKFIDDDTREIQF